MTNQKNQNTFKSPSVLSSLSFSDVFSRVKEQIDIYCFDDSDLQFAEEIAYIITEVLKLPPDCDIRIDGTIHKAQMVQEVYSRIRNEHVKEVISSFQRINIPIKNKKAYLRTVLYNAIFELEASGINFYKTTMR
jgi:hypothetical protein